MCYNRCWIINCWNVCILLRNIKSFWHLILFFGKGITFFLGFLLFTWSFICLLLRLHLLLLFFNCRSGAFFLFIENRFSYLLTLLCHFLLNISLFLLLSFLYGLWFFWMSCLGDRLYLFGFVDALGNTDLVLLNYLLGLELLLGLDWDFWLLWLSMIVEWGLCWFFDCLLCCFLSYSRYLREIGKMVLWDQKRSRVKTLHIWETHRRKEW